MGEFLPYQPTFYEFLRGHFEILPGTGTDRELKAYCDDVSFSKNFSWIGVVRAIDSNDKVKIRLHYLLNDSRLGYAGAWQHSVDLGRRWANGLKNVGAIDFTSIHGTPLDKVEEAALSGMRNIGLKDCSLLWQQELHKS